MSEHEFSPTQCKAIYDANGENFLISAGAGSGKTAVLTERIYDLAKKENTLKNFLILTFTKLAAGEMKARVRKKLLKDPTTVLLASQVDNAHIETFDSFTLFLTQKYSYALNVSSNLSVIDSSVVNIKRRKVMDELFEKHYLEENTSFIKLMKEYCKKDDSIIKEFILKIIDASDKTVDKYGYLNHLKNDFYNDQIVDQALNDYVNEIYENIKFILGKVSSTGLEDASDEFAINNYLAHILLLNDYDKIRDYFSLFNFPSRKGKQKTSDVEFRNAVAEFAKKKIKTEKSVDYGDSNFIRETYLKQKEYAQTIVDLAIEVEQVMDEYKKEHNVYSYGDISRFALKLIENEFIRKEISESFKYIMIDEYQDTNEVQEKLISAIGKDNIYMVGDVKQSIYKFRGADCTIFQDKYIKYKHEEGGKEIDLNTSYRSRKEIVDFINETFTAIMDKNINTIDYSDGHLFGFGQNRYIPNNIYIPEVYNYDYSVSADSTDKETELIIQDIISKKNNHFQVYDLDNKVFKDCDYKDFAVITGTKTQFAQMKRKFEEAGIPVHAYDKEDLFSSDIVFLIKNLLKLLKCSLNAEYESNDFKHAFMSVARSFLFEYPDGKLHNIVIDKTYLLEPFMQKIELIKEKLRFKSIKEIVVTIYDEFALYDSICKITQFYANTHKAETILNIAGSLDSIGFTFDDFVEYFDQIAEIKEEVEFKDDSAGENSVTLINIHASKGLEYRIVYYSMLNKQFVTNSDKNSFVLSDKYGLLLPYTSGTYNSIFIHLSNEKVCKEDFEEKIRELYVALTRAKEKIIILNGNKEVKKQTIKREYHCKSFKEILAISNALSKYASYVPSFEYLVVKEEKPLDINKIILKQINVDSKIVNKHRASKALDLDVDESLLEFGRRLHNYLENVNFESKDLSFISDYKMKKYVSNVVNSKIFSNVKNNQIKKEFYFYDEEQNLEGYIDALIIKENEIDIVDYKIKNISDEHYDQQLNSYRRYISRISNKPVKMFLLAAITGESREVYEKAE